MLGTYLVINVFSLLFHMIMLIRDKCAIQRNNMRHWVVTAQQFEVCVLTLITILMLFTLNDAALFLTDSTKANVNFVNFQFI